MAFISAHASFGVDAMCRGCWIPWRLQVVMSHLMWMLRSELGSSGRAGSIVNCWEISLTPKTTEIWLSLCMPVSVSTFLSVFLSPFPFLSPCRFLPSSVCVCAYVGGSCVHLHVYGSMCMCVYSCRSQRITLGVVSQNTGHLVSEMVLYWPKAYQLVGPRGLPISSSPVLGF